MKNKPRSPESVVTLVAALLVGLIVPSVQADDKPSRDYPPTYSSRKKPWYDISDWFTFGSADDSRESNKEPKAEPKRLPESNQPMSGNGSLPAPSIVSSPPPVYQPSPAANGPAWKWYGYGAPVPNANSYAPNGQYEQVPLAWHQVVGSTPGAVPIAQLRSPTQPYLEQPRTLTTPPSIAPALVPPVVPPPSVPVVQPPPPSPASPSKPVARKPILPEGGTPYSLVKVPNDVIDVAPPKLGPPAPMVLPTPVAPTEDVAWKPAKLATPIRDETMPPSMVSDKPHATLKPPVVDDQTSTTPKPEPTPSTPGVINPAPKPTPVRIEPPPGFALPSVDPGTPDLPINPATGIRLPD